MSIPLDRLYYYIESIAKEIRGDDVLIYRFWPHGSKKIEDLSFLNNDRNNFEHINMSPIIHCNDQEPLDYERYTNSSHKSLCNIEIKQEFEKHNLDWPDYNLRINVINVYDYSLLIHSEQRSTEVQKYQSNFFVPVYYWSHAVIARDWFRYAQHQTQFKRTDLQDFLIYNRAWSGTRDYRIKFADLLIDYNLVKHCKTSFNSADPETNINYQQHNFSNPKWIPSNSIEQYFKPTAATACSSADFDLGDYCSTRFEVVLETLFDDSRLHLTEKSLRPIACGQPFILVATHGSLAYLRSYGFQTFNGIIDESYDLIEDPCQRLVAVVQEMQRIANWTESEKQQNSIELEKITQHNRTHFFSDEFSESVENELRYNLRSALDTLENKNTSNNYFALRKQIMSIPKFREELLVNNKHRTRQQLAEMVKKARQYHKKSINK
jgi:hypothetical protein